MRSYCAVYVDVGYLLASAATRVTGSSLRSGVEVDYPALVAGLIAQVEADSGLPILRVNWYDSGSRPGGQPDWQQDQIGLLPRVKLRLGRLSYAGEQKGVDVRLGLDLALQGRARVADVVYLVSGDDDLTEAVEEAQGSGVQVVLLSVPGQGGSGHAVSKHLRRAADGELLVDAETIDHCVRSRALADGLTPKDEADEAATSDAQPTETRPGREVEPELTPPGVADHPADGAPVVPEAPVVPKPSVPRAPDEAGVPADRPAEELEPVGSTGGSDVPSPAAPTPAVFGRKKATEVVLPSATPSWSTTTGDEPVVAADGSFTHEAIDTVAKNVLASWCRTATPADLQALRAAKPTIPGELDRALLLDLSGRTGVYDIDDASRHEVRDRFWYHVARVRLS
ncbi:hypothetical protein N802_09895 [Knoellia sinensis KCTC 19936]|uniref:NYN domain-containing protein n=1 Tax=Knoellia sinensis KCTC 19936 TaxID=1385520 RepID=A0A0A0IZ75_9MICO|nr:NYN domain-containing protein [Knoellia sinensis]KGN30068.1 hypothetical protein N802_09895 [Knoellia sinensis KCTC 19936]